MAKPLADSAPPIACAGLRLYKLNRDGAGRQKPHIVQAAPRRRLIHHMGMASPNGVVDVPFKKPAGILQRFPANVAVPQKSQVNSHGSSSSQLQPDLDRGTIF
jgi:hypothetical protein